MDQTPEALVAQLEASDGDKRALALDRLVRLGAAGVPPLRGALRHANADVRALAAEGLAQIGDASAADSFRAALNDSDERVRSQAATGLARIGDPHAVDALIRTLNDNPDLLRAHLSLSAYTLMGMGRPALDAVAPLLRASDERERIKAIWIIRQIAEGMTDAPDWAPVAKALGSYDPWGRAADQITTANTLIAWLRAHPAA